MRFKLLFLLLVGICFFPVNVNANCKEQLTELNKLKNNIKLKYTYQTNEYAKENYQIDTDNLYTISVYNLPKELKVMSSVDEAIAVNNTAEQLSNAENFSFGFGGDTFKVTVYTSDNYGCFANLGTIDIKLPWYNTFSEKDECKNYKDFKYCKKYLNVRISEKQFNNELKRYISNNPKEEVESKEEKNFLNFITENIIIISIGSLILIAIIIYIIIKLRRIKRRKF